MHAVNFFSRYQILHKLYNFKTICLRIFLKIISRGGEGGICPFLSSPSPSTLVKSILLKIFNLGFLNSNKHLQTYGHYFLIQKIALFTVMSMKPKCLFKGRNVSQIWSFARWSNLIDSSSKVRILLPYVF